MGLYYEWDGDDYVCATSDAEGLGYGVGKTEEEAQADFLRSLRKERELLLNGDEYPGRDADLAQINAALEKYGGGT